MTSVELPDEHGYWAKPGGPTFSVDEVARLFFGHENPWLYKALEREEVWLDFDGLPLVLPRGVRGVRWELRDVERTAHALTHAGRIPLAQLHRIVSIIKLVAEQHAIAVSFTPLRTSKRDRRAVKLQARRSARRPSAVLRDAFDGSFTASPRRLGINDIEYEIDLSQEHWAQVLAALAPVLARATLIMSDPPTPPVTRAQRREIAAWAEEHGFHVGPRGMIAQHVLDAYHARSEE